MHFSTLKQQPVPTTCMDYTEPRKGLRDHRFHTKKHACFSCALYTAAAKMINVLSSDTIRDSTHSFAEPIQHGRADDSAGAL
jgi:hypothetical protein